MVNSNNFSPNILNASQINLLFNDGIITKDSLGVTKNELERIYTQAKKLYDSGKFKEALAIFSILVLLDPKVPAFLYGLASSCLMLNNCDSATEAFLEYATLVPTDPMPYYYISSCYEKKNDIFSAMVALQTAINRAEDQPQYQELKNRALLSIEHLKKLNFEHAEKMFYDRIK